MHETESLSGSVVHLFDHHRVRTTVAACSIPPIIFEFSGHDDNRASLTARQFEHLFPKDKVAQGVFRAAISRFVSVIKAWWHSRRESVQAVPEDRL